MAKTMEQEMTEMTFGQIKTVLGVALKSSDCQSLCSYFDMNNATTDKVMNAPLPGLQLLNVLTDNGDIQEHDVTKLEAALRRLHLGKAANIALAYQKRFAALCHWGEYFNRQLKNLTPLYTVRDKTAVDFIAQIDSTNTVIPLFAPDDIFPEDPESDGESSERDNDHEYTTFSFDTLLGLIGLEDKFPGRLRLERMCYVTDPDKDAGEASLPDLFWQKLGSLDYRARSSDFLKNCVDYPKYHINVRDFIFAFLHCSDSFLRQDVLEKMSACQLAVPIILQGVKSFNSTFMSWSLRRIIKEWKRTDSSAVEHHIVTVPLFSVSFLRIGDIKDFSKSSMLNYLLGPLQGHHKYSYFLSKEDDSFPTRFAAGCVEGVWYLPTNSNGTEKLKWVISVFNLRGDAACFDDSMQFSCRSTNMTFAFIAKRNQKIVNSYCSKVKSLSKCLKFIVIDDEFQTPLKKRQPQKWIQDCLFVRNLDIKTLCDEICATICMHCKKCPDEQLQSLESLSKYCENIEVEDDDNSFQKARLHMTKLCDFKGITDLVEFKAKSFPLQSMWSDWVAIDKEPIKPDGESELSVDLLLDEVKGKKQEKRLEQLECGLSDLMLHFQEAISSTERDMECFGYFASYLQEELRRREDENIRENLDNIVKFEETIERLDKRIKDSLNTINRENDTESNKDPVEPELREQRKKYERLRLNEARQIRDKSVGWEHFIRELGQWYEAHTELEDIKMGGDAKVLLLPADAARLLIHGHAVEIMDGDTGRVPLLWVSSVLKELACKLDDPEILVVCAVGVQSSGKSTLLNTMFGVQFPVRSGQCTRGLFLRVLKVDDAYVKKLGVKYIFLVDSEGIRSQEKISKDDFRFDNELVTLVLCISDVTLLNISGENVGPDMTGLLQIAAHALIRMKKVNMHSQCRIVQQRVSKVTAEKRNKVSMTQIETTLNAAIREVSVKEGFGKLYEQFSDIFDLRRGVKGENLQYFPPLWTGSMSPPNEMYGHIVTSVKKNILKEVEEKVVKPQFTVLTFQQRIRDVWTSVKDERFLFNFQDSIKAMDFDNLCMEVNTWLGQMKLDLIQKRTVWQMKIANSTGNPDGELVIVKKQLDVELKERKKSLGSTFLTYASEQPRTDFLLSYTDWYNRQVDVALAQEESHVISSVKNEVTTKTLQNDIPNLATSIRVKLRKNAKDAAARLQKTVEKTDPEKLFSSIWETWIKEHEKDFPLTVLSETALEATCEDLLFSITTDMAVSSGIKELIEEGGIKKHSVHVNWKEYYPIKGGGDDHVEQWFKLNTPALESIIEESVHYVKERNSEKKFDANLLHYVLRDALQKLSVKRFSSEPHCRLKAKVMLHICGKLFDIVLQQQRMYEKETSFHALMENEKESIRKDFVAFFKCDDLVQRIIHSFRRLLSTLGCTFVFGTLQNEIVRAMLAQLPNNRVVNIILLSDLMEKNLCEEYIGFTKNNMKYFLAMLERYVTRTCCEVRGGKLVIQLQAYEAVNSLIGKLQWVIKDATSATKTEQGKENSTRYKLWVYNFMQNLSKAGIVVRPDLSQELLSYDLNDIDLLVKELSTFIGSQLKDLILPLLSLPDAPIQTKMGLFLRNSSILENTRVSLINNLCFEQCPLCGAACENPLPTGPSHGDHYAYTHLPRGISGNRYRKSSNLDTADCVASVGSSKDTYTLHGKEKYCKNYKADFPSWSIRSKGELVPMHSDYWKWVMKNNNADFAKHYNCQGAKIPQSWRRITKEHATQSLRKARQMLDMTTRIELPGRMSFQLNVSFP